MASIISAGTTSGTSLNLSGDTSGVLQLASNGSTTAVTINTSQNVGIGTSSPANKLVVSGTGTVSSRTIATDTGGDASFFVQNNAGSLAGPLVYGSTKAAYGALGSGETAFYSNAACTILSENVLKFTAGGNTERMRIDTSGTLFIGATSSPSGTQRLVLTANGSAGIEPMLFNELRSSAATENYVQFYRNGSQVGSITNTLSATAYLTSSDYRLKENIAPMTGALAKVSQLKPCTYTWKATGETSQGFIAHELQEIVPDCVSGAKDAVETYTDEDGNEQTRIKPQGIDTSFLVATLTAAIQELKAELDATKAEVQALKGVA